MARTNRIHGHGIFPKGSKHFIPSFGPHGITNSRYPLSAEYTFRYVTPTNFLLPDFVYTGTDAVPSMSVGSHLQVTIPDVAKYKQRVTYQGTSATDTRGYEWFMAFFKHAVYPQFQLIDTVYKDSTQQRLLQGLKTYFTSTTDLDVKTLIYQAIKYPTPVMDMGTTAKSFIRHSEFADWMHGSINAGVSLETLAHIADVIYGQPLPCDLSVSR